MKTLETGIAKNWDIGKIGGRKVEGSCVKKEKFLLPL